MRNSCLQAIFAKAEALSGNCRHRVLQILRLPGPHFCVRQIRKERERQEAGVLLRGVGGGEWEGSRPRLPLAVPARAPEMFLAPCKPHRSSLSSEPQPGQF